MKRPARKKKRPTVRRCKAETGPKYKFRLEEKIETAWSRDEFTDRVRAWVKDFVSGHSTRISMSRNAEEKISKPAKFYYRFWCMSCSACSWCGTATYHGGDMQVKFVDVAKHGSFDATYAGRGGLSVDQQNCVRTDMRQTKDYKLQHWMRKLREHGGPRPDESKVSKLAEKLRQHDVEAMYCHPCPLMSC